LLTRRINDSPKRDLTKNNSFTGSGSNFVERLASNYRKDLELNNPQKRLFSSSGSRMVSKLSHHLHHDLAQNSILDKSSATGQEPSSSNVNTTGDKSPKKILFK
jgi:hypothetical protein